MGILLSSCLQFKSCDPLDFWLMGILKDDCCINFAFNAICSGVKFLLCCYCSVINNSIIVLVWNKHAFDPFLYVFGSEAQV